MPSSTSFDLPRTVIAMPMLQRVSQRYVMSDLPESQNKRLRAAMRAVIGDGKPFPTITALGEAIGRSQPSLSDFLNEKSGASMETALRFAEKATAQSVDEILGPREKIVEPQRDPFPSRERAIDWARREGYPESVLAEVRDREFADGQDPGGEFWIDDLKHKKRLFERGAPIGSTARERRPGKDAEAMDPHHGEPIEARAHPKPTKPKGKGPKK